MESPFPSKALFRRSFIRRVTYPHTRSKDTLMCALRSLSKDQLLPWKPLSSLVKQRQSESLLVNHKVPNLIVNQRGGKIWRINPPNYSESAELSHQLFVSDYISSTNNTQLKQNNIYSVLTIGNDMEQYHFPLVKGGYQTLPIYNGKTFGEHMKGIFRFINCKLSAGNVLVHSLTGTDRSCAAVALYLMVKYRCKAHSAVQLVCSSHNACEISSEYMCQLLRTEYKLKKGFISSEEFQT